MEDQKISIIIPVYNMEHYLEKCVKSVLQQSYQYFEVLLVDDGSTDSSGELCDDWAAKDSRIQVIHKENGGLSDARNTGLDAASGNYVSFVDSDDYIAPDMMKKLHDSLLRHDTDMSVCNVFFVDEAGNALEERNQNLPIKDEILTACEAIEKLMEPRGWIRHLACGKLYKKNLFSAIRFPKGKYAEDAFVAHRLLGQCKKVACISDACYYYVQRSGSFTHSKTAKSYLHDAESFLDRAVYCEEQGLYHCAGKAYWQAAMYLPDGGRFEENEAALQAEYADTLHQFRGNRSLSKYCTAKEKLQIALVLLSPKLYQFFLRNPIRQQAKALLQQRFKRE